MKDRLPIFIGTISTALTWQLAGDIVSVFSGIATILYLGGCIRLKYLEVKRLAHEIEKEESNERKENN